LGSDDATAVPGVKARPRQFLELPLEPQIGDPAYSESQGYVTRLIPLLKKRAEEAGRKRYDADYTKWKERLTAAEKTNERIYAENLRDFEEWKQRAEAFEKARRITMRPSRKQELPGIHSTRSCPGLLRSRPFALTVSRVFSEGI